MKLVKLPIGKANIVIKQCPTKAAQGAELKKGYKKLKNREPEGTQFNKPVLCISLRKAA